jgi:tungstate transport system ATP-binding protein
MRPGRLDPSYALEAAGMMVVLGGKQVLEVPSLRVSPNEVLMVVGPNGSGKTTLLLCLALLLRPATGIIAYRGVPVSESDHILRQRRRLAVVFQESLLLNSSVWDNVTIGLRLRGVERGDIKPRARQWLERFGIGDLARRQARTLSGGEAKRASLARAFALQPEVLFLDEPFAALDAPTRRVLLDDFEMVLKETRTTAVMVTHDRNEALILGDRVAVLMNGSIRQMGSPAEVFSSPVDEEVAEFVEAGNIMHGEVVSQDRGLACLEVGGVQLQVVSDLAAGSRVTAYMHYDDVTLTLPGSEAQPSSARNRLTGRIVRALPVGSMIRVTVDCGFPLSAIITRRSWEELGLETGRKVVAAFKAASVHLLPRH